MAAEPEIGLKVFLERIIEERDRQYSQQFRAAETAVNAALAAQEKSVNAAFAASEKAISKAEEAKQPTMLAVRIFRPSLHS